MSIKTRKTLGENPEKILRENPKYIGQYKVNQSTGGIHGLRQDQHQEKMRRASND